MDVADNYQHAEQWLASKLQHGSCKGAARETVQLVSGDNILMNFFHAAPTSGASQSILMPGSTKRNANHVLEEAYVDRSLKRCPRPAKHGLKNITSSIEQLFHFKPTVPASTLESAWRTGPSGPEAATLQYAIRCKERQTGPPAATVETSDDAPHPAPSAFCLPLRPATAQSSAHQTYHCLSCDKTFNSKGAKDLCKRHMEDVHVAPPVIQCFCTKYLRNRTEARQHLLECTIGATLGAPFTTSFRRNIYVCEYTGEFFGQSHTRYLDHLVSLAQVHPETRPVRSLHRKVRAILRQPGIRASVEQLSCRLFGSPEDWDKVEWRDRVFLHEAVLQLERGDVVDFRPGHNNELTRRVRIRDFLEALFQAGELYTPAPPPYSPQDWNHVGRP